LPAAGPQGTRSEIKQLESLRICYRTVPILAPPQSVTRLRRVIRFDPQQAAEARLVATQALSLGLRAVQCLTPLPDELDVSYAYSKTGHQHG